MSISTLHTHTHTATPPQYLSSACLLPLAVMNAHERHCVGLERFGEVLVPLRVQQPLHSLVPGHHRRLYLRGVQLNELDTRVSLPNAKANARATHSPGACDHQLGQILVQLIPQVERAAVDLRRIHPTVVVPRTVRGVVRVGCFSSLALDFIFLLTLDFSLTSLISSTSSRRRFALSCGSIAERVRSVAIVDSLCSDFEAGSGKIWNHQGSYIFYMSPSQTVSAWCNTSSLRAPI